MVTIHNKCRVYQKKLSGHFVTTSNKAFETELTQEDEGYEGGSESFNIPIPPSRAPIGYHVSTMKELDPAHFGQSPTTTEHHEGHSPQGYRHCSFTHCCLVFTNSDDESPVRPSG